MAHSTLMPSAEPLYDAVLREAMPPFDTNVAPLFRATVLSEAEAEAEDRWLVLTADRLVADWTMLRDIARDLQEVLTGGNLRTTQARGLPSMGKIPGHAIASSSHWLEQWTEGHLAPMLCQELPFACPTERLHIAPIGWRVASIPDPWRSRLKETARELKVSVGVLLLSATVIALWHATQVGRICLWTDFDIEKDATHSHPAHSHAISVALDSTDTIRAAIQLVSEALTAAEIHKDISLDLIWTATEACLEPPRDQISFHHLDVSGATSPTVGFESMQPMLETDPRMSLQFRSFADASHLSVGLNFNRERIQDKWAVRLLESVVDVVKLILLAERAQRDVVPFVVGGSQSVFRMPASDCYLCGTRSLPDLQEPLDEQTEIIGVGPQMVAVGTKRG